MAGACRLTFTRRKICPALSLFLTRPSPPAPSSIQDNYKFAGGLHGVGVSVVNALSETFEVSIKRDGKLHNMTFKGGKTATKLAVKDSVGKRNTGTLVKFKPDPKYFDSPKFSVSRLKHLLRAKAVLCPGLKVTFCDETASSKEEAHS